MKRCLVALIALATLIAPSTAAAVDLAPPWADSPPFINGVIGAAEWAAAASVTATGDVPFNAYFLANGRYLYFAFDVTGDTTFDDMDGIGLYFDNANDHAYPTVCPGDGDGNEWVWSRPDGTENTYRTLWDDGGTLKLCTQDDSAVVYSRASIASGHMVYEGRLDFTGDEMYGSPGESIGFAVYAHDETIGSYTFWPAGAEFDDQTGWADLIYPENPDDDDDDDNDTTDDDDDNDDNDDAVDDDAADDDDDNDAADDDDDNGGGDDDDSGGCGC
jgi:hypothetical protein